jgi:hypothetical protein
MLFLTSLSRVDGLIWLDFNLWLRAFDTGREAGGRSAHSSLYLFDR